MTGKRAAIFAVGLSLVFGAQLATAAKTEIETKIEGPFIRVSSPEPPTARYAGELDSETRRCELQRKVTIIHDSKPPFTIGKDKTDTTGEYSVVGPLPPKGDKIIVRVDPRDLSTKKRERVCLGARETAISPGATG